MLSTYQTECIAFAADGEIICRDCAISAVGEHSVHRLEHGLSTGLDWRPLTRYEVEAVAVDNGRNCRLDPTDHCNIDEDDWCEVHAHEYCGRCLEEIA